LIWKEARVRLTAAGLQVVERSFGLEGYSESPAGRLRFQMGASGAMAPVHPFAEGRY